MIKRLFLACALLFATVGFSQAELVMSIGDYNSNYNPNDSSTWNQIDIQATDGQLLQVNLRDTEGLQITGAQLYMYTGDGDKQLSEPIFEDRIAKENVTEFDAGIFGTSGLEYDVAGSGPEPAVPQYFNRSVAFKNSSSTVGANGLLAEVSIDASGFAGQSFEIYLLVDGEAIQIPRPSVVVAPGGDTITPVLQHAVLNVVPEPSSLALVLCGLCVIPVTILRRRWMAV